MMYIAICDDNAECRKRLELFCEQFYANREEMDFTSYASGEALLADVKLRKKVFDLVLLDIEMEKVNGIQVKKYLEKIQDTLILFVTSHEQYMPQAFGYRVLGFLKKPVQYTEFRQKMEEAIELFRIRHRSVMMKIATGERKILLREIDYIEGDKKLVKIYPVKGTEDGKPYIEYHNYGYWTEKLADCDFWEARKGCLINLENMKSIGSRDIIFEDGRSVKCAVRRYGETEKRFQAYVDKHAR